MVPLELTQSVFVDFSLQFHGKFCSMGIVVLLGLNFQTSTTAPLSQQEEN
jgi:hypothetical protein